MGRLLPGPREPSDRRGRGEPRPFVGVSSAVPEASVASLNEEGYITDASEHAGRCAVLLDAPTMSRLGVRLLAYVESSNGPLAKGLTLAD